MSKDVCTTEVQHSLRNFEAETCARLFALIKSKSLDPMDDYTIHRVLRIAFQICGLKVRKMASDLSMSYTMISKWSWSEDFTPAPIFRPFIWEWLQKNLKAGSKQKPRVSPSPPPFKPINRRIRQRQKEFVEKLIKK